MSHTPFWSLLLGVKCKLHLQVPWLSNLFAHNTVSSALFVIQEISQPQRTQTSKSRKWICGMRPGDTKGDYSSVLENYQISFSFFFIFLFFLEGGVQASFFFNYRMQIRIRYLPITLKAHVFTFKHVQILVYHFIKSLAYQTKHCFISC